MKKICYDRILPQNKPKPLVLSTRLSLIAPLGKQWINGTTLRVYFMEGTPDQHDIVKAESKWWEDVANIRFAFGDDPRAEIRIKFDPNDGAWSYVGTDNSGIPFDQPTMNLGFLDQGTAAHEFGHAIGLAHEHQNPEGGIEWNVAEVIRDLSGPPNYWDEDTIRHNVLEKYSFNQIKGTKFDPTSIMCYAFPEEWTLNHIKTQWNSILSDLDKSFIGGDKMYPKAVEPPIPPTPTVTEVKAKRLYPNHIHRTSGSIRKEGEEDLYVFTVQESKQGHYRVDTRGNTNVALRMFGPNSITALIAEDDDSGVNAINAQIQSDLRSGEYYVQVRHSDLSKGKGSYSIKVFYYRKR